jgi:hypothetical protein
MPGERAVPADDAIAAEGGDEDKAGEGRGQISIFDFRLANVAAKSIAHDDQPGC